MLSDKVKTKLQSLFLQECNCPGRPHIEVCLDCIRNIASFAANEAVAVDRVAIVESLEASNDDWLFDFQTRTAIPAREVFAVEFAIERIIDAILARGEVEQ